ncbi:MAG: hypothetical protein ACKOPS_05560, partial [Cyanobium sp.]
MQTQAHNGKAWQPGSGSWLRSASAASGLLLAPQRFEAYAAALHRSPWLPAAELALMEVAVAHLGRGLLRAAVTGRAAGDTEGVG